MAWISGSVGVLSEGIHSFLDLVSAAVAFFTIREAGKPADDDHPYGHGKIETLSSLFESLLLIIAAALIVFEGLHHLRDPHPIQYEGLAIVVIAVSMAVSFLMYRHNSSAATETESSAIHVNALHFLSDVLAGGGVIAGLLVMKMTGWLWVDPVMAFAIAAYIVAISWKQVRSALHELADTQLPEHEVVLIRAILERFHTRLIEAHDLRTRRGGTTRYIDFHLVLCGKMTVNESHSICDEIEAAIEKELPRSSVNIHVEPCTEGKPACEVICEHNPRSGK